MMTRRLLPLALSLTLLSACTLPFGIGGGASSSETSSGSSSSVQETKDVIYQGTLNVLGSSIYMEGTHKLDLEDGRFLLLESVIDLKGYEGKHVEVMGAVRPTVEAGGQIMRVQRVTLLESSAASSEMSASGAVMSAVTLDGVIHYAGAPGTGDCTLMMGTGSIFVMNVDCPTYNTKHVRVSGTMGSIEGGTKNVVTVETIVALNKAGSGSSLSSAVSSVKSSKVSSAAVKSIASSLAKSSSSVSSVASKTTSSVSSTAFQASDELTVKAATMAQADMGAAKWTQQYCSTPAGFCAPIHKNWYFKSFGATTSALWRVEVGPTAISNLGEGPLVILLLPGASAKAGVSVSGDTAVGAKDWTEGRHFEVRAPASLQAAVQVIIDGIKPAQ